MEMNLGWCHRHRQSLAVILLVKRRCEFPRSRFYAGRLLRIHEMLVLGVFGRFGRTLKKPPIKRNSVPRYKQQTVIKRQKVNIRILDCFSKLYHLNEYLEFFGNEQIL